MFIERMGREHREDRRRTSGFVVELCEVVGWVVTMREGDEIGLGRV